MSGWLLFGHALGAGGVLAAAGLLAQRQRTYQRHIHYDPRQDCVTRFSPASVEAIPVRCDADGFVLPEVKPSPSGGLLELSVRASTAGRLLDPAVDIEADGFRDSQIMERGVRGTRFLNVSRLLAAGVAPGAHVTLRGRHLSWRTDSARLHVCREAPTPSDRVLIVAAHPDDAEIAAYGLYADAGATVATLTAGEDSDRYSGRRGLSLRLPRAMVARVRVWDSLTVPQLGGVRQEQCVNFCYPDGRLQMMRSDPARDFRDKGEEAPDFDVLRRLNSSPFVPEAAACSWDSLVRDLGHLLAKTKPTVIVAPHPWLDPNTDHAFSTLAVCEALRSADQLDGRFYFYVNHNRRSELWPFGSAGGGVPLLPMLAEDVVDCDGFYSHILSVSRQREKFLALEAMHDVRDLGAPEPLPVVARLLRLKAEAGAALHGLGLPPTSFLRRAVRPDELFLTTSLTKGRALCERVLRDS